MDPAAKAAYVQACAVSALIEAIGMIVTNQERFAADESPAYDEKAFLDLIVKYQIGINDVLGFLQNC